MTRSQRNIRTIRRTNQVLTSTCGMITHSIKTYSLTGLVLGLAYLAGCTVGPDYQPTDTPNHPEWLATETQSTPQEAAQLADWWASFEDPTLTELIERASSNNRDAAAALARIEESRALLGVARGDRSPRAVLGASYERLRLDGPTTGIDDTLFNSDLYGVGIDASWEIDLFGRIRRSIESADANLQVSIEDYRDIVTVTYAEVARTYYGFRTAQARLSVAQRNVENQAESLNIVTERWRAELVSELDVRQAQALLAESRAEVPQIQNTLTVASNRLCVLLGVTPGSLDELLSQETVDLHNTPRTFMVAPGDVVRQRPDIRKAERQLAAQTARVGIAAADLYPRLSLLGSFAFEAEALGGDLFESKAATYSFGPRLQLPILNRDRLRSMVNVEDARVQQALMAYESAVLRALEESESALDAIAREKERGIRLKNAVDASSRSYEIANDLYRTGLVSYQRVLDSQRELFATEDALIANYGMIYQHTVALYQAFGGGWALADETLNDQITNKLQNGIKSVSRAGDYP